MKVVFESNGDFDNLKSWLKRMNQINPSKVVQAHAKSGTQSLKDNTPKATGETASGWKEQVKSKGGVVEVGWINTAHPQTQANIALLIELGHGTGTGGYVPPKPYIKRAMNPIWAGIDDKVIRELIK